MYSNKSAVHTNKYAKKTISKYTINSFFVNILVPMKNALDVQQVIRTYTLLYKLVFRFGHILLALLWWSLLVWYIITQTSAPLTRENTSLTQEKELILAFDTLQKQTISHPDINLYITQGPIDVNWNFILSKNNYATYKWFVLPQTISIDKNLPLREKSYFEAEQEYEISELELYLKNLVYTVPAEEREKSDEKRTPETITLPTDIITYFNLWCTQSTIYIDTICQSFIKSFTDSMHVYALSLDYNWLIALGNALIQWPDKEDFCQWLQKYIVYTNDNSWRLTPLIDQCGGTAQTTFDILKRYVLIQQELTQDAIWNNVFTVSDLNAYKLLSTQQSLYQDIAQQRFDEIKVLWYIKYIESLMRESDRLDPLYFDMIYSFHHDYLLTELAKLQLVLTNKEDSIKIILQALRELDKPNTLINHKWLPAYLTHAWLVAYYWGEKTPVLQDTSRLTINERFTQFGTFNRMRLQETVFSGDTVSLAGEFVIESTMADQYGIDRKLPFTGTITWINQQFVIQERSFTTQERMSTIVSDILSQQIFTVPRLYDYVTENIATLLAKTNLNKGVCDRLTQDRWKKLSDCDDRYVRIMSVHPWTNQEESYYFRLSWFQLDGFLVADRFLYDVLSDVFVERDTNELTLADTITALVNASPVDPRTIEWYIPDVWANKLYIIEQIQAYLWIIPTTIQEQNGVYLVAMSIQWHDFVMNYNLDTNTLWPLLFAKQPSNRIMNFSLILDESSRNAHDDFVNEPIEYLFTINEEAIKKYRISQ